MQSTYHEEGAICHHGEREAPWVRLREQVIN